MEETEFNTGKNPEDIGIRTGEKIDIRTLKEISDQYNVRIILFFEKDAAEEPNFEKTIEEYKNFPEYERPYVELKNFLKFASDSDPEFIRRLEEFPLMIKIVRIGKYRVCESELPLLHIMGLMPFLDEMEW